MQERVRVFVCAAVVGMVMLALPGAVAGAAAPPERLCTETLVPMSDGVRLHAWVSRLAPDRPRPVLFMMDSYARGGKPGKGPTNDNACPQSLPDDYVPAYLSTDLTDRFTLIQVSYRGTGSSEGLFDVTGHRTQQDLHEAIAWAAGGPWSTGDVTLIGESGTGFAAFHGLHEPHVKAAVMFTSCPDMYRCVRRGGQYNTLADVYMASTTAGYVAGLGARARMGALANPDPLSQLAALGDASVRMKTGLVDDAWWRERSALGELRDVRIPVLLTTDLYDIVQPFDALQLIPGVRLNLGMGHLMADAVKAGGKRYSALVRAQVDRFVAHYALGEANGAERDPRVTLMTNLGSSGTFHAGQMLVRPEAAWPLPATRWTRLYLGDGTLTAQAPPSDGGADDALLVPGPHTDLRTDGLVAGQRQRTDLRADEAAGLTYTTPELERNLEISGPLTLRVFASATAPDFDWAVRVADVWPDGRSEWITDGYLRASLRKVDPARSLRDGDEIVRPWLTYDTPQPVPLGRPVEYLIDVIGTSNVFRAGHRLRLDILPAAQGGLDAPVTAGAGVLSVLRDAAHPSSLLVPVIPGRCASGEPLAPDTPKVGSCASTYRVAIGEEEEPPAPAAAACASRRRVRVHLRDPRGSRLRSARVYVNGRLVRSVRVRPLRAFIDLRGLPRGRFTVRIVARTTRGRVVVQTRRYRTCTHGRNG